MRDHVKFWHEVDSEKLECLVCGHRCHLSAQQTGRCGVRKNTGAEIVCLTAGRLTAVNPDPMEKKPLYHFLPGQRVLSIGSWGCNMSCPWCQNWEISQNHPLDTRGDVTDPGELVEICLRQNFPALGFTYNEPTVALEYMLETFGMAKRRGLKTVLVTNGFFSPEAAEALAPVLDGTNIDLKHFSPGKYVHYTSGRLELVKENIAYLVEKKVWVELTTLVVPGVNDDPEEWTRGAEWIKNLGSWIPWHLNAYHPSYKMDQTPATSPQVLRGLSEVAKKVGLDFVYLGNLSLKNSSTRCPDCGQLLVDRMGYKISLTPGFQGVCPDCGKEIPGRWKTADF